MNMNVSSLSSQTVNLNIWLCENLTMDINSSVSFGELYVDYKNYTSKQGIIPLSKNMVSRHFRKMYESPIKEARITLVNRKGVLINGIKIKQINK